MSIASRFAEIEAADLAPQWRAVYDRIVSQGNSPQFAMMCIHQQSPKMSHSDRAMNETARRRMMDMQEDNREKIVSMARMAGINTHGKYYNGQLGTYTDPLAWVSTDADIIDVAKKRKLKVDGTVKCDYSVPTGPVQGPLLAEDIVQREVKRVLRKEPETRAKLREGKIKKQELRERVIAKHGRKRMVFGGN